MFRLFENAPQATKHTIYVFYIIGSVENDALL
jgi:hypothetical protein